jgi:excinuclease ABC subunit C
MRLQHSAPFNSSEAGDFLASLPASRAIFVLWPVNEPAQGVQPYIGRTGNLRHRLERLLAPPRDGLRRLNLHEFTRRLEYQCVGSSFEATWLLYQTNRAHYPRTYRRRLRLRPPVLLKVNLQNRFPRCYPARSLTRDGSLYYGPFPSRADAEHFAGEFLDFFKIRRCVEDLNPDPNHPGCIYSQMKMCLAPCFGGCTDAEYQAELDQAVAFLDTKGASLERQLEAERERASEALDFEEAARVHRRLDKVSDVLRRRAGLAGNVADLHALIVERGAELGSVVFFRVWAGELLGPAALALEERVAAPAPLDLRIRELVSGLVPGPGGLSPKPEAPGGTPAPLPPWEHLAILARWYYSSFREGEFVPLARNDDLPHRRLIRLCRKLTSEPGPPTEALQSPG